MFMTQLESAVAGVVTKEMKVVAEKERMDEDVLRSLVAAGKVVIPCNKQHTSISPEGIGKRLRTKVNVNLGTSKDVTDYDSEIERLIELFDLEQSRLWTFPLMVILVFLDVN